VRTAVRAIAIVKLVIVGQLRALSVSLSIISPLLSGTIGQDR
jgi:hypothetical protein